MTFQGQQVIPSRSLWTSIQEWS